MRIISAAGLCLSLLVSGCGSSANPASSEASSNNSTLQATPASHHGLNEAPAGFVSLFNGTDFNNWLGRKQDYSPYAQAKLSPEELAKEQAAWNADMHKHWRVDRQKQEIVSDGHGVYLTTDRDYGDFELYIDWLMVSHGGDSGIYLRTYPQVQIWDPENPREVKNGAEKGSGALWNNNNDNPGKWPLVKADNPVGEWNTFHIKMIGSRVWVWLNNKLTVDGQVLDNYFDRKLSVLARGPIELQTHGSEIRFRNVFIREIGSREACETLGKMVGNDGYKRVFNGKDFTGWAGPTDQYEVVNGALRCKPAKGGTIYTQEQYGDFEAKVEFRLPPAGNNGLAIRYPGHGDTAYDGMCELQILDDSAPVYEHLDPRQYCGSIYGVVPAQRGYLHPMGQWNFEHVTVKGHTITVELNGTVITNADVSKFDQSDTSQFMHNSAHPGLMREKGSFGFAGHTDPVEFRNVEIKKLD